MSLAAGFTRLGEGSRATAVAFTRMLAAGAIGGGITGFLIGGFLGRLVMRLLTVTSPRSAQGVVTDDGFIVGEITASGTMNLVGGMTAGGTVAGLLYLMVRRVLPAQRWRRSALFALLTATVGGALSVHDHSTVDFSTIEPEWLAVASFIVLPGLYGLIASPLIDRFDAQGSWVGRAPLWLLVGLAVLLGNVMLAIAALPVVAAYGVAMSPIARQAWQSHWVGVAGTVLFVGLVAWGVYDLVTDVVSIATNTPSTARFTA